MGIYVDGALNLEAPVVAAKTASVFVTGDLELNNNIDISSADTYIGSGKNLTINKAQTIVGTERLIMEAMQNLTMNSVNANLSSKDIVLRAVDDVLLNAGSLQANAVNVFAGDYLRHNGTVVNADEALFYAEKQVQLNSGSLTAQKALLMGEGKEINEPALLESSVGYNLDVNDTLTLATKGASLYSKLN